MRLRSPWAVTISTEHPVVPSLTYMSLQHLPADACLVAAFVSVGSRVMPCWCRHTGGWAQGAKLQAGGAFCRQNAAQRLSGCEPSASRRAGKVSMKADIFSFGVVLWEIITLERPAWRGNLRDIR